MHGPRFRVYVMGSKHDYIRRYKVVDTSGSSRRRVDGVVGGLNEDEARDLARDLNEEAARRIARRIAINKGVAQDDQTV